MTDTQWMPIESAPKDGSRVWVKRVHEGLIVKEGRAVFGAAHEDAPQRQPLGPDPLNRLSGEDYAAEAVATKAYAEQAKWLNEDKMYSFPSPTHWKAEPPKG